MTIKELIQSEKENFYDFQVWQYADKTRRLHTDFIKNLDSKYSMEVLQDLEVKDFYIMSESEYNESILINSSVKEDFLTTYDCKEAKILVIMIDYTVEL